MANTIIEEKPLPSAVAIPVSEVLAKVRKPAKQQTATATKTEVVDTNGETKTSN